MKKLLKIIGKAIAERINVDISRTLNSQKVEIPVINGVKAGVSGEKWMSGVLKEIFKHNSKGVFYDVGVNLGQTLMKVKTLNKNIKYIGFEPNPSCLSYLQCLIQKNNWTDVIIVPVGLSNQNALLKLYGENETDPKSTIIEEFRPALKYVSKLVPVFKHDSIMLDISKEKVIVIKIDVEGAELEVLESLFSLIKSDRPVIVLEVLPKKDNDPARSSRNKKMIETFEELEYSFYRIIKTSHDTYEGVCMVDDVGDYFDPVLKDHIVVPNEIIDSIENMLTIKST